MSDGTRGDTTTSVQIEELKRAIRALPFVTKLSPVRAHNGHGDGWGVSLRCSACEEYGRCGKKQETPVQVLSSHPTLDACLQELPGHGKDPWDGLGAMAKTKVTRDLTDGNVQTPSGRITSPLEVAQHLRAQFCSRQWKKERINMKINQVVVMYLDADEIVRPVAPPDVSPVKCILSSYSFLFLGTPGHYCMRKYSCWCKACSLVRGRGHGCVSRHKFLDVPGCLRSKLTVWKEEQFTVLPFQGIEQRKKRVAAKALPR